MLINLWKMEENLWWIFFNWISFNTGTFCFLQTGMEEGQSWGLHLACVWDSWSCWFFLAIKSVNEWHIFSPSYLFSKLKLNELYTTFLCLWLDPTAKLSSGCSLTLLFPNPQPWQDRRREQKEQKRESTWAEIKMGRSLTNYHYGQNRLDLRKGNL